MIKLTAEPLADIEELVGFEERGPGSDAERRAALHLVKRLEALGRQAGTEPVEIRPGWPLAYAFNTLLAIVGSVLAVSVPVAGAALVAVAALATLLDANGVVVTSRRLFGRRASQNVVSEEDGDKRGVLVLVAHMDSGRGGLAFAPPLARSRARLARKLRLPLGPLGPLFWAMVGVLVPALVRIPGIDSPVLTVIQFVPTVILILALPLLLDVALAAPTPGANDNASGVATVLKLAERYGGKLQNFELWVLFTGGGEAFGGGMRSFVRRHRNELQKERTVFVNIDEVGSGEVRYSRREGPLATVRSHVQLLELCGEIAEDDEGQGAFGARAMVERGAGDAYAARAAGYPAITITCRDELDLAPEHHQADDTPEQIDSEALERAFGYCSELVERLDAEIGPELETLTD